MLVMVSVPLTLLGTRPARLQARLDDGPCELRHELRLPADNPAGRNANVAAVLTQRDATNHSRNVWLTEASVGARSTALSAIEARVDARDQCVGFRLNSPWMRLQHLLSMRHEGLLRRLLSLG